MNSTSLTILPPLFCPPVSWFAQVHKSHCVVSEYGLLQKQSLLNRCWIKTAQGAYALTLPLLHTGAARRFENTRISYHENWSIRMLRTLTTNYRKAAYYEYYFPEIETLLQAQPETLLELNHQMIILMCRVFRLNPVFAQDNTEFRLDEVVFPPKPSPAVIHKTPYFQLYGDFISGLSALDLLFHYGPDGNTLLSKF